tara:strand:+ start:253 stop:492 length:240 start_codon:yes stop_codon:yes gene_type:complete
MATVMNEKIQKISEEYVNGMIDIIMESLNRQIDAKFEEHFDGADAIADAAEKFTESRIREIATEEAEGVIQGCEISIDV